MKHRGIVMSRKGMVASAHPLISTTGVKILRSGGNAMDAAVAMANVSGVVLPDMCGLGGDAFFLFYDAKTKKITAMNGSGGAPEKMSREWFEKEGYSAIPKDGLLSVTIPGQVDALFEGLAAFGTMKFSDLCEDAIDLAENGCPLSEKVARHIKTDYDKIQKSPSLRERFLNQDGSPLDVGKLYYNKDYAKSLKLISQRGKQVFYQGEIAEKIVHYSKKHGGQMEIGDFKKVKSEKLNPIYTNYRGYTIYQTPPVSQGIIHLEEMSILNQISLSKYPMLSAQSIHYQVEAKKLAFKDRIHYCGDPDFVENPIDLLLSVEHAKKRADQISIETTLDVEEDMFPHQDGHTASFVVVDKDGNAVSFIHSIAATWGSGVEVEGTGILLNNRAGVGFNLVEGHPNCINPFKRTMHTLNTYMIADESGKLKWVGNTPGGDNQPQWNMQVVSHLIDYQMDVQSAVEAPKWADTQSSNPKGGEPNILKIEKTVGEEVLNQLRKMGHKVMEIDPYQCSGASQVIEVKDDNVLFGGSDPRADGCAIPE